MIYSNTVCVQCLSHNGIDVLCKIDGAIVIQIILDRNMNFIKNFRYKINNVVGSVYFKAGMKP